MMKDKPSFPARLAGWEYQYERAEKQAKAIRDAIKKLDGPGMPDRAREAIHILMEAVDED